MILSSTIAARQTQTDVALDSNNIALDLQLRGGSPANAASVVNDVNSSPGTRQLAIQWLDVNDATVPLTGENNAYYANLTAPNLSGANKDHATRAAVTQASHDALVGTLTSLGVNPSQQTAWTNQLDTNLNHSLSNLAASPTADQSAAIAVGRILDRRRRLKFLICGRTMAIYVGPHFTFDNTAADLLATQVGANAYGNILAVPEPAAIATLALGILMPLRRRARDR